MTFGLPWLTVQPGMVLAAFQSWVQYPAPASPSASRFPLAPGAPPGCPPGASTLAAAPDGAVASSTGASSVASATPPAVTRPARVLPMDLSPFERMAPLRGPGLPALPAQPT